MNQFTIPYMAAVTVTNVNVRTELHGDGHVPAADISIKMSTTNHVLTEFDGALRAAMYKPADVGYHQGELDGIEPISDLPLLRCASIEQPIKLKPEFVGYTLEIDRGLGTGSNIVVMDCALNKFRADCKEGGTVDLMFRVQASQLKEEVIGKLATLIGSETRITLTPPEERQAAIDGTVAAFEADVGGADDDDATDAFVKAHA
jgi:hypothetical protein